MYYGAIKKSDVANGEGIRTTIFVSGCRNRCKNCFQPETWAFDYGRPFDDAAKEELFSSFKNPVVRGLTVLGGEPMEPENQVGLLPLLREFKERFPDKTVWLYTCKFSSGYATISRPEGVRRNALRAMCPKSPHSEDETRA